MILNQQKSTVFSVDSNSDMVDNTDKLKFSTESIAVSIVFSINSSDMVDDMDEL